MRKRIFKLGGVLVLFALAVCVASTVWAKPKKNLEVYVIGDSLSDSGNLYALTGFFPFSPPYDQRFSDGPIWAEYFAEQLGVNLDDRAYGGAFTGVIMLPRAGLEEEFSNYNSYAYWDDYGLPLDLPGVQEEIEGLLADHPKGLNPKALYVVWAGANDFFAALENQALLDSILTDAVENIAGTICRLSEAGAKHFAVANIPDIGLTPYAQGFGKEFAARVSFLADRFNQALEGALRSLPKGCAKTLVKLDAFTALQQVVAKPGDYGLINVTTSCLQDLAEGKDADCTKYLFWDGVHPTTAGHALFAERFRDAFCGESHHHPRPHCHRDGEPPEAWRRACQESD